MAVDNPHVIDAVGIERETRDVILTISDHLDWNQEREESHLLTLQAKLNSYLHFVLSGQLIKSYPDAIGLLPVISVVAKFPLSPVGEAFIRRISEVLDDQGISFRFKVFDNAQ